MNEGNKKVSIWNPEAAAKWSILFSPIFGGWLISNNWKTLGNEKEAKASILWAYAGIALIVMTIILNFFVLSEGKSSKGLFFIYLLVWYFLSAKKQIKYIKETYSNEYDKKSWMKPIGIAIASFLVYILLAFGISTAAAASTPTCDSSEVNNILTQIIKEQGITPYGITRV